MSTRVGLSGRLAILGLALLGAASAADIISGLAIGATTQTIPVTDVTGHYKGERICYVCDFDKAPNVLAFFRDTSDATAKEIVQLNDLYVKNKSRSFKTVVMIVAGESSKKWLEELQSDRPSQEIPLTFFTQRTERRRRACLQPEPRVCGPRFWSPLAGPSSLQLLRYQAGAVQPRCRRHVGNALRQSGSFDRSRGTAR